MKKHLVIACITAVLAGCGSTSSTPAAEATRNFTISTFAPGKSYVDLQIVSECPVSKVTEQNLASELLSALVPSLIDTVVGSLTEAVKRAGEDKVFKLSAHNGEEYFYAWDANNSALIHNTEVGCMIVSVHDVGLTIDKSKKPTVATNASTKQKFDAHIKQWSSDQNNPTYPVFYAELRFEKDTLEGVFRLTPQLVYTKHGLKEENEDEETSKKTVLAFDFRKPGDTSENATFGSVLMAMQGLQYEKVYSQDELKHFKSVWMAMPSLPETVTGKIATVAANKTLIKTHKQSMCEAVLKTNPASADSFCDAKDWGLGDDFNLSDYQKLGNYQGLLNKLNDANRTKLEAELKFAKASEDLQSGKDAKEAAAKYNEILSQQQILAPVLGHTAKIGAMNLKNTAIGNSLKHTGRFEVHLEIAETTPGSRFMKALGQILEGSKDNLTTVLKNKFDPATKKANAETAAAASEQKLVDIYELNKQLEEAKLTLSTNQLKLSNAKTEEDKLTAASAIAVAQLTIDEITRKLANLNG